MRIQPRDPGWLATLLLGGAALLVSGALIAVRLAAPSEGAVIRTESWPWRSDGVVVEPAGSDSRFVEGDVVTAMAGVPIEDWIRDVVRWPWEGPPATLGNPLEFEVVRDGRLMALSVPLTAGSARPVGSAPVGLVVFGAGVLVLALVLMLRRTRSTALRLLFVGAASNTADIVAWELGLQPTDLAGTTPYVPAFASAAIFNLIFWSTIVHILAIFPVRSRAVARRPWLVPAIYLAPQAALLVLVVVARLAGGTVLDWVDRLAPVTAAIASAMLVVIIGATVAGYRRTGPAERRTVRAVAATLLFAAVATLVLLTGPIAITGMPLVPRSTVALLAMPVPVALAISVIRDRLFQVSLLSRSREAIIAAREEERRRLRRELHDGLAPTLAAVGLRVDQARSSVRSNPDEAEALLSAIRGDLREAIADIRRVARDLRPPALDALGLAGAVRQQAESLQSPAGGGPVIIVDVPDRLPALPAAVEVAAYRVLVEGMMNVIRHADASTCRVTMRLDDGELAIEVVDDGVGMSGGASGVGTRSIRERAAEVGGDARYEAANPRGTRLVARLPVDPRLSAPALLEP